MPKTVLVTSRRETRTTRKIVGAVVILALFTLVIQHPTESANWATQAFTIFTSAVEGLAAFLRFTLD